MACQAHPSTPETTRQRWRTIRASIARGREHHVEIRSRRAAIVALDAPSDAELAEPGLRRADIPRHVFRGVMTM